MDKIGESLSKYIGKKAIILGGIPATIDRIALEVFTDNHTIKIIYIVYFDIESEFFKVKYKYWNAFFGDDEFQEFIKGVS